MVLMPIPAYEFRFVVDAIHQGMRIDTFLASRLRNHPSARLLRLIRAGLVRVDDQPCETTRRMRRGEEITLSLAEPPTPFYDPQSRPIEILYEDHWIAVVNKPAGLLVHPAGPVGDDTLANVMQNWLDRRGRWAGLLRPGIVHRLDRNTSGVIIIATDQMAHASLGRQFERRNVRKSYIAIVKGRVSVDRGVINRPIGQHPGSSRMTTNPNAVAPRNAKTDYEVLARLRSTTVLLVRPLTGRKHQIRVHLAVEGYPILGDSVYGERATRATRHALHAASIAFQHPVTGSPLRIDAPLPNDFWETLSTCGGLNTRNSNAREKC